MGATGAPHQNVIPAKAGISQRPTIYLDCNSKPHWR